MDTENFCILSDTSNSVFIIVFFFIVIDQSCNTCKEPVESGNLGTRLAFRWHHTMQKLSEWSRGRRAPPTERRRAFTLSLSLSPHEQLPQMGPSSARHWKDVSDPGWEAFSRCNTARRLQTAPVSRLQLPHRLGFTASVISSNFQPLSRIPAESEHSFAVCLVKCFKWRNIRGKLATPSVTLWLFFWIGKKNALKLLSDVYFHQIKMCIKWKDFF